MSDTTSDRPPIWDRSFSNDLATAWENIKSLGQQLVPPDHPWYQKVADVAEAPVKLLASGAQNLLGTMSTAMHDPGLLLHPDLQHEVTRQLINLAPLGGEAEGLPSFPAWHGSRHTFEPQPEAPFGQFREEKMGSGEGAQVYGWGHYIAGAKETADYYRTAGMEHGLGTINYDGREVNPSNVWDDASLNPVEARGIVAYHDAQILGGNVDDALRDLKGTSDFYRRQAARGAEGYMTEALAIRDYRKEPLYGKDLWDAAEKIRQEDLSAADATDKAHDWLSNNHHKLSYTPDTGNLYQVWVKPEKHELLDLDKNWSAQSDHVQEAIISKYPKIAHAANIDDWTGGDIYSAISKWHDTNQEASEGLDAAGVPGLKYADQGSRHLEDQIYLDNKVWKPENGTQELAHHLATTGPTPRLNLSNEMLQDNLNWGWNELSNDLDFGNFTHSKEVFGTAPDAFHEDATRKAMHWIHRNQDRLTMGDHPDATHNYVMFHHRHINIIDRNGKVYGYEPVDHDPTQ